MPVNIVLPTLSAWAASRLTNLLESKSQSDFNALFEDTFAAHCSITVNGKPLSREEYKSQLLDQSAAAPEEKAAVVTIEGQTEVETGNQGQLSGLVGIFYSSLSDSKFLVLGAPAENRATSSVNFVIEPTEKNPVQNPKVRGYFDPRRVTVVNQVVAESTYHVTIPAASVPKTSTADTSSSSKRELGPEPLQIPPNWGPFGGRFGPGPVRLPQWGPLVPEPVVIPPTETGAGRETLPGNGEFGVGPVIIPGETIGGTSA